MPQFTSTSSSMAAMPDWGCAASPNKWPANLYCLYSTSRSTTQNTQCLPVVATVVTGRPTPPSQPRNFKIISGNGMSFSSGGAIRLEWDEPVDRYGGQVDVNKEPTSDLQYHV